MKQRKLEAGTVLGPYTLHSPLGEGGMAQVWLATLRRGTAFQTFKALKIPKQEERSSSLIDRFRGEVKLGGLLRHPNVVTAEDYMEVEGFPILVMEFVDGLALDELIGIHARLGIGLEPEVTLHIVHEILKAIEFVHSRCDESGTPQGIIHRDMKPSNVLLSRMGEVKITDFGVARAEFIPNQTSPGMAPGTYQYMAPEQIRGGLDDPLDGRADVFAIGAILFELLCLEPLYACREDYLQQYGIAWNADVVPRLDTLQRKRGVDSRLVDLVSRSIAVDRANRWCAAEMLMAVRLLQAELPHLPAFDVWVGSVLEQRDELSRTSAQTQLAPAGHEEIGPGKQAEVPEPEKQAKVSGHAPRKGGATPHKNSVFLPKMISLQPEEVSGSVEKKRASGAPFSPSEGPHGKAQNPYGQANTEKMVPPSKSKITGVARRDNAATRPPRALTPPDTDTARGAAENGGTEISPTDPDPISTGPSKRQARITRPTSTLEGLKSRFPSAEARSPESDVRGDPEAIEKGTREPNAGSRIGSEEPEKTVTGSDSGDERSSQERPLVPPESDLPDEVLARALSGTRQRNRRLLAGLSVLLVAGGVYAILGWGGEPAPGAYVATPTPTFTPPVTPTIILPAMPTIRLSNKTPRPIIPTHPQQHSKPSSATPWPVPVTPTHAPFAPKSIPVTPTPPPEPATPTPEWPADAWDCEGEPCVEVTFNYSASTVRPETFRIAGREFEWAGRRMSVPLRIRAGSYRLELFGPGSGELQESTRWASFKIAPDGQQCTFAIEGELDALHATPACF